MHVLEHLEDYTWQTPDSYGGHNPVGDYVVASINRDSPIIDQSNWHTMRKQIEKHTGEEIETDRSEGNTTKPYDFRAGHWACGWIEYLIIPKGADEKLLTIVAESLCALSDYPLLDEMDYSERQHNAVYEYWMNCNTRERVEYAQECKVSIFSIRHDLPEAIETHLADSCEFL